MAEQRITSKRFDVSNHTINRAIKQDFIFRVIPIGFFGYGPNLKFSLTLWWLHHGCSVWQWMRVRLEDILKRH